MARKRYKRGTIDRGLYWQDDDDASGYAAGGVTVLATRRTDDGRMCREVFIETAMERRPTCRRVRTGCHDGGAATRSSWTRVEPGVPRR